MFTLTNNSATALSSIVPTIAGATPLTSPCSPPEPTSAAARLPAAPPATSTSPSRPAQPAASPQPCPSPTTPAHPADRHHQRAGVSFVSNVGAAEAFQAVTVTIATAGTPSSIQVLTQGAANLDFTETTGGTCSTTTAYTAGQTCTVNVVFKPRAPEPALARPAHRRKREHPRNTFLPAPPAARRSSSIPTSRRKLPYSQTPRSPTTHLAWRRRCRERLRHRCRARRAPQDSYSGGTYGAPVTIASGFGGSGPYGVAVDGAGNVFASDYSNSQSWNSPGTHRLRNSGLVVNGFVPQPSR